MVPVPTEGRSVRVAVDGVARYVGGQRLYFAACTPWLRATVVVDNTDLTRPTLVDRGSSSPR